MTRSKWISLVVFIAGLALVAYQQRVTGGKLLAETKQDEIWWIGYAGLILLATSFSILVFEKKPKPVSYVPAPLVLTANQQRTVATFENAGIYPVSR